MDISFFPPVEFGDAMDPTIEEPLFILEGNEELDIRVDFLDFHNRWMRQVIVVVMTISCYS